MMSLSVMFALTGAVQGWVLWWLWRSHEIAAWPATDPQVMTAGLYAAVAVPLAVYFTQNVERLPVWVRRIAVGLYLLLHAVLGAYTAWAAGALERETGIRPTDVLAALVLGFVSLNLLCGFDFDARRWRYERLFHYTWRNGILLATALAMVGVVWMVLFAGAGLMSLIGVRWVIEVIRKPAFGFPVTGLVVAGTFALGLRRAALIEAIRRFWLSIAAWLLPLVLFFALLWVLALPFTGLEPLFQTRKAAFMMLGFTALAVTFANCAYQDGESAWPYPRWLGRAMQAAWLTLLIVVVIAWWALGQRVAQHGLSEQRLWAGLAATLAVIYAAGYALSWLRPARWMAFAAPTNIVAALVLCLGLLAYLSPLANVREVAVAAHLRHVVQSGGSEEPDWTYLRWDAGRFGREALKSLAAGEGVPAGQAWARQAVNALAETSRYSKAATLVDEEAVAERFVAYPKTRSLPNTFIRHVKEGQQRWEFRECLKGGARCAVWIGDLNRDGVEEVVMFNTNRWWSGALFTRTKDGWRHAGYVAARDVKENFEPAQLEDAHSSRSEWSDLVIQGKRLQVRLDR